MNMLKSNKYGVEVGGTYASFFSSIPDCVSMTQVHDGSYAHASIGLHAALKQTRRLFVRAHAKSRKVIFIGNGGSGAIASHMAIDYSKNGRIRAIALNDHPSLTCLANDFGYDQVFAKQLEFYAQKGDVVTVISTSGRSKNILEAAAAAKNFGCELVTFSGMQPDNNLRTSGCINFYVPCNDYGAVEITHLILLHSMVGADEYDQSVLTESDVA